MNAGTLGQSAIDFSGLRLSLIVRRRLASIEDSRHRYPRQKMMLADRLLRCAKDAERGLYIPFVSHPRVPGKITTDFGVVPKQILASKGTPLSFFCNALLLPADVLKFGFGRSDVQPMRRTTNPGFVVITIEHDQTTKEGLEYAIQWTAKGGKLFDLDKELRQHLDYDGFCAVWSGNKSVHLHFVFDTTHLLHAPSAQLAAQRWASYSEQAAVMAVVHRRYFDHLVELSSDILCPSIPPDMRLRSHSQFRRMPWGLRCLDRDSDITGLRAGTVVLQLVLAEKIRESRAAKGSATYLVPPHISVERNDWAPQNSASRNVEHVELGDKAVAELGRMCWSEWRQEYPKPVRLWQDREDWVINFKNHPEDQNPATVCRGGHDRLLVQGGNAPQGQWVLPGGLTANELGDYLGLQYGIVDRTNFGSANDKQVEASYFERLKQQSGRPFKSLYEEGVRRKFPIRSSASLAELQAAYRDKLRQICASVRSFDTHAITLSSEGIGKTTALFDIMANEALDTALGSKDKTIRFNAFAFRSELQAIEKAQEYKRETGRPSFLWRSFRGHYEDACRSIGCGCIPRAGFENETDIVSVTNQIRNEQPAVFHRLEAVRRRLWIDEEGRSRFHSNTMLFTTHATVMSWVEGQVTRTWHHPAFDPSMTTSEAKALRDTAVLQDVVFDEPEYGEFVWLLPEELYAHLASLKPSEWKHSTVTQRRDLFEQVRRSGVISSDITFEGYSELRYLDLSPLERVEVDFSAQPFGRENSPNSIYRRLHGKSFYVGAKNWPFAGSARITYLTTEAFTAEAIAGVYKKSARSIINLELDQLPPLYPVVVPLVKEKRARTQNIQELAKEILASSDRAVVIADGLKDLKSERAITFQGMKGHNGLSDKDVFIIETFLAPEVYAELNVLGKWLRQQDTVAKYYAARISQAVGRNTGFRQQSGTKTVVVMSNGLLRQIRPKLEELSNRFVLQLTPEAMWEGGAL